MQVQHVDSLKRPIPFDSNQAMSQRFADYRRRLEGMVVEDGHDLADLREAYWEGGVEKGEHHGTWPVGWSRRYLRELRKLAGLPEPKTARTDDAGRNIPSRLLDLIRGQPGGLTATARGLAERCGTSHTTVMRYVKKLASADLITVKQSDDGKTLYRSL